VCVCVCVCVRVCACVRTRRTFVYCTSLECLPGSDVCFVCEIVCVCECTCISSCTNSLEFVHGSDTQDFTACDSVCCSVMQCVAVCGSVLQCLPRVRARQ